MQKGKGLCVQGKGMQKGRRGKKNPKTYIAEGKKKGQLRRDLIDNGLDNVK